MRGVALAAMLAFVTGLAQAAARYVTDDRGVRLGFEQPVARIVTLAPHLAELVYAAGAGPRLVGVSAYSDHPPAARALPVVGDAGRLDLERIVALKPDLVLAWLSGNPRGELERLSGLGIKVVALEPRSLEDIARHLELVGKLAGSGYEATRTAARFRSELRLLQSRYAGRRPVTVFYQIWDAPLTTVNGRHLIDEAIRLCGGRNVFADLPGLTPTISLEALLAADPEAILVGAPIAQRDALLAAWRARPALRAVRTGQLFFVDADLLHRATPRMLEGAGALCEALERVRR